MQTRFSAAQLEDPDTSASESVLRTCVHCGFCTATCPTFVLLGDERDSPRGRIYLIQSMLERGGAPDADTVRHVDRCLTCLSCMTTCPSGVNYLHLVDHARAEIERRYRRPWHDRALRAVLAYVLPRPGLLHAALEAARLTRPLATFLPRQGVLAERLQAMFALAPMRLPDAGRSARPGIHAAQGERRARVALLTGCAQSVLAPHINEATIRLLTRLGVEVVVTPGIRCCGALTQHMGKREEAEAAMRAAIEAWHAEIGRSGLDAILVNTSGCGTTIKEYGHLFRTAEPGLRARAEAVAARAQDITEFLDRFGYTPTREPSGLRVAYHAACSLQHGQQVRAAPKRLLETAGFEVVEPREAHLCCGSAGTYNLLQPAVAQRLRGRKLDNIAETEPDLIASGNLGCLNQLAGPYPALHTVELLDWMAGGPVPEAIAGMTKPHTASRGLAGAAMAAVAALLIGAAPESAMLDALKAAPDRAAAAQLEAQIQQAWHDQATEAVQVLEDEALASVHMGQTQEALKDCDAAIDMQPQLADLWRRRGEVRFVLGDDVGAAADLAQSLAREPRLYPAFADLSRLEEARGNNREALAAWKKYLELDPQAEGGGERLHDLTVKVEGQAL